MRPHGGVRQASPLGDTAATRERRWAARSHTSRHSVNAAALFVDRMCEVKVMPLARAVERSRRRRFLAQQRATSSEAACEHGGSRQRKSEHFHDSER